MPIIRNESEWDADLIQGCLNQFPALSEFDTVVEKSIEHIRVYETVGGQLMIHLPPSNSPARVEFSQIAELLSSHIKDFVNK